MGIGMIIFGQISSLAEISIVIWFIIKFLQWKTERNNRYLSVIVLLLIIYGISQVNGCFPNSYYFVIAVDILVLLVFCSFFLKGNWILYILGCSFPFLVIAIINVLMMQLLALCKMVSVDNFLTYYDIYFVVGVILSKIILFVILVMACKVFKKNKFYLPKGYSLVFTIIMAYTVAVELLLFHIINNIDFDKEVSKMLIVISVCIALTTSYVIFSMYAVSNKNYKLLQSDFIHMQYKQREKEILELEKANFRERQLRHDYRNHCINLQELVENGKEIAAREYLSMLVGKYINRQMDTIYTGNNMLDAMLNAKISAGKDMDVTIQCLVIGNLKNISKIELCIILFNLLDNAMDGCQKIEKGERKIEVEICKQSSAVELFVKNTIRESVLKSNKKLFSDKEGEHGVGHLSVARCVEELGGFLEYYEENNMFCAHVFIPMVDI